MSGDETTASTPSQLGSYRLERVLGRGGMGAVFLAYDTTLHRRVALKMLDDADGGDTSSARLLREARNAAALNHPNICTIHEVGSVGGSAFIAMEFVEGRSLRDRLAAGAYDLNDVVSLGIQAAEALAYAHANGVVHRDFKAANIIVGATNRLKVVDFGLARRDDAALTDSTMMTAVAPGTQAGTPYAMAPEQVRGERADARTDIWALGVLLYEMAAGRKPFNAPTTPELFSAILRDAPPPLPSQVPAPIRAIVERCLDKDPAHRYQDAASVKTALEDAGAALVVSRRAWSWRTLWPVAAAVALGVAAAISIPGAMRSGTPPAAAAAPPAGPIRLAVLPFNNLTGDPEQEYFVDGLTDEAITQLGRLQPQRLSVIASRSAMRYKNATMPIDQIGRELNVDYVLEGSARREGQRVRITARLVQASDHSQLWTDAFERELTSMMALQNDVARGVANSLSLALLPEEKQRLATSDQVNAEAYEAYLRGLGHVGKLSRSDLDRALEYFERAIDRDSNFALAYLGIGRVWSARSQMQYAQPREAAPRIRAALERAVALTRQPSAELEFATAAARTWTDWNWAEGGAAFQRALAIRPNYAEAHAFYGHYLTVMRRPQEAIGEMERAIAIDPFNDLIQALYGVVLTLHGRYDEAIAQFRKAIETSPGSPVALNGLARALHHAGRFDEALAAERTLWQARGDTEMVRVLSDGSGGYHAALRKGADVQAARMRKTGAAPLYVGTMYIRAGAQDEALAWLRRSFEARDPNVPYVEVDANWASVSKDPRFIEIHQKLGLP